MENVLNELVRLAAHNDSELVITGDEIRVGVFKYYYGDNGYAIDTALLQALLAATRWFTENQVKNRRISSTEVG